MGVPTRSKSIGIFNAGSEAQIGATDGIGQARPSQISSSSHLANLRSISRGKPMTPSSERRGKPVGETKNLPPDLSLPRNELKRAVTHGSVDLLTPRMLDSRPSQRRKTLAGPPRRPPFAAIEEEPSFEAETPLNGVEQILSPQILGGLEYKTSANGGKRAYRPPRNSIDNADVSRGRPPLKRTLETTWEDDKGGGQADRISVFVRLRPISSKEKEAGARCCVRAANKKELFLTEMALDSDYLRLKRLKGRYFAFDAAFSEDSGQEEVYRASTAHLVEGVLDGRNSSVFCYGATGAGKTYTMLGTVHSPGVMVLALKDLFSKLKQRSREGEHVVRLSYLEVYNETVRDLLSPGRALVLREDAKQGIVAAGLTQYKAFSADEVMALLQQGNQNRTTEPTRVNETSSRSHAILQVVVEYKANIGPCSVSRIGKLSLIDLAGSERALATDQRTLRSLEGANINRSLLALSSCINALVEGKKHIPFRNSKLTQLLKDSLGGACQTAMIANISPSNLSFGETQNTLYWADRAKEIRTKECVTNEELQVPRSDAEQLKLLLEVQKENQQLRMQLAQLQQKLLTLENNALALSPAVQGSLVVVFPSTTPLPQPVVCRQKENHPATDSGQEGRIGKTVMKTPVRSRDPLPKYHTSSKEYSCRKRTFWDITNANSPSAGTRRNTRSHTAAETPSLLLQPGFLRRRTSFN